MTRWFPWVLFLLALFEIRCAHAGIIVAQQAWNDGSPSGWTSGKDWSALSNPGSGGINDTVYLRTQLDTTPVVEGEPGAEWYALARTPPSSFFAGNWQDRWVEVDFLSESAPQTYVQVRWQPTTNSAVQQSAIVNYRPSPLSAGALPRVTSPAFSGYTDWDYGGANQEQFVSDLASLSSMGGLIWHFMDDEPDYGPNDSRLMVPEPGEYMMLASALLSAVFSFRKRLRDLASGFRLL